MLERSRTTRQKTVAGLIALCVVPVAGHGQESSEVGPPDPFRHTRIHADSSGGSHFSDEASALVEVEVPGGVVAGATGPLAAESVTFFCFSAGTIVGWHPAPRRQLYLILSGELELQVSDGEVREFGPSEYLNIRTGAYL